jgi:hypothetical protein
VRLDGIGTGDIIRASIGGRVVFGEVLEIRDGVVYFNPISRASGWRHATAAQVTAHWRRAGRRRPTVDAESGVTQPPEQLALRFDR